MSSSTFSIVRPLEITEANMSSNMETIAPGFWVSTIEYPQGYLVHFGGEFPIVGDDKLYRSIYNGANLNHQPDTSPTYWAEETSGTQYWLAGTTYSIGDKVWVSADHPDYDWNWAVFESLASGNTGNDPKTSPTEWALAQIAYPEWNLYLSYGANIVTWGHNLYEGLPGGANHQPDTSPTYWQEIGPAGPWAAFDQKTGTQATMPSVLQYVFTPTGRNDTIAFINVAASNINITVNDGTSDVYDEDFNLVSTDEIYDWYTYFLEEATTKDRLYVSGIPAVLDPTITITLTGETVAVGLIVIGRAREVGETTAGASIGIQDFSVKKEDGFGGFYIKERGYSDEGNFSVSVPNAWVDGLRRVLSDIRATPTLFVGTEDYTSTYYYGICTWSISFDYYQRATAKIEITGL